MEKLGHSECIMVMMSELSVLIYGCSHLCINVSVMHPFTVFKMRVHEGPAKSYCCMFQSEQNILLLYIPFFMFLFLQLKKHCNNKSICSLRNKSSSQLVQAHLIKSDECYRTIQSTCKL